MSVGVGQNGFNSFTPFSLFSNGEDGFLYDFSKTDRLFQDTAGTTAVALDADPIGLALEGHAWGGKTLPQLIAGQAELNLNPGPFANAIGYTASSGTLAIVGDEIEQTTSAAAASVVSIPVTTVVGQFYVLQYDAHRGSSSTISIQAGTAAAGGAIASATISSATSVTGQIIFKATTTTTYLQMVNNQAVAGRTGYVRQLSCKAIPGNHGLQATNPARPLWKTPNFARFDGSDDTTVTGISPPSATAGFLGARIYQAAGNSNKVIMGARTSSGVGSAWFNIRSDGGNAGLLGGIVGDGDALAVKGNTIVTGRWVNVGLGWSGGTYRFYTNGVVDSPNYAITGSVTSAKTALGSLNVNGAPTGFDALDMAAAIQINREPSPAEILALSNYWNAQ
jgi:hypothetical protein